MLSFHSETGEGMTSEFGIGRSYETLCWNSVLRLRHTGVCHSISSFDVRSVVLSSVVKDIMFRLSFAVREILMP